MYGQMTAGSWIYIGTQGILQGTYQTFAAAGEKHYGSDLAGRLVLTAGLGGMGGAQPLAVTMAGGVALCVEVDPHRIERRLETAYVDVVDRLARRGAQAGGRGDRARASRSPSPFSATPRTSIPSSSAAASPPTLSPTRRRRTTCSTATCPTA